MRKIVILSLAALLTAAFVGACSTGGQVATKQLDPAETLPKSLHGHPVGGMGFWYAKENGGFENDTGIPYSQLACKGCHQPKCDNCHKTPDRKVANDDVCYSCHSRQGAEGKQGYRDVHKEKGMRCTACHGMGDLHGDGKEYETMLARPQVQCVKCHAAPAANDAHDLHQGKVDCSACHMQAVVTCYNCHFETEVNDHKKVPYGQFKDFQFLLNRGGKVFPGNMQTVTFKGKSFVVFAPYYSHTILRKAHECNDCHDSAALREYNSTGKITVSKWDESAGKLAGPKGVIPIPPDYEKALQLDFVDLKDGKWVFLKSGADRMQMITKYGAPLTAEQLKTLTANKQ